MFHQRLCISFLLCHVQISCLALAIDKSMPAHYSVIVQPAKSCPIGKEFKAPLSLNPNTCRSYQHLIFPTNLPVCFPGVVTSISTSLFCAPDSFAPKVSNAVICSLFTSPFGSYRSSNSSTIKRLLCNSNTSKFLFRVWDWRSNSVSYVIMMLKFATNTFHRRHYRRRKAYGGRLQLPQAPRVIIRSESYMFAKL